MLPACVGLVPFGIVCGVGAAAAGASWLTSLGMSAIIFSGAAQIVAAQMLAADAPFLGHRAHDHGARPAPADVQRGDRAVSEAAAGALAARRSRSCCPTRCSPRRSGASTSTTTASRRGASLPGLGLRAVDRLAGRRAWRASSRATSFPPPWSLEFAVPLCFIALVAPLFRDTPSVLAAIIGGHRRAGARAPADEAQPHRGRPHRHR